MLGSVESLNVSVSAGIFRLRHAGSAQHVRNRLEVVGTRCLAPRAVRARCIPRKAAIPRRYDVYE